MPWQTLRATRPVAGGLEQTVGPEPLPPAVGGRLRRECWGKARITLVLAQRLQSGSGAASFGSAVWVQPCQGRGWLAPASLCWASIAVNRASGSAGGSPPTEDPPRVICPGSARAQSMPLAGRRAIEYRAPLALLGSGS